MRDKKPSSPSLDSERDVWKEIGSRTLVITLIGYLTLISYTWPQGFIPLVSVQSLPILLLGFVLLLTIVFIVLGIFFLPFWLYENQRLVEAVVRAGPTNLNNPLSGFPVHSGHDMPWQHGELHEQTYTP
jgi:hypothetical protein